MKFWWYLNLYGALMERTSMGPIDAYKYIEAVDWELYRLDGYSWYQAVDDDVSYWAESL